MCNPHLFSLCLSVISILIYPLLVLQCCIEMTPIFSPPVSCTWMYHVVLETTAPAVPSCFKWKFIGIFFFATIVGSLFVYNKLWKFLYGAHCQPQLIFQSLDYFHQFGISHCQFCDNVQILHGRHCQVVYCHGDSQHIMCAAAPWLACS